MLRITVPGREYFIDKDQEFIIEEPTVLELEHSLVSLSKWEQKFEKPFLAATERTEEEAIAYIEAMIVTEDYPPDILSRLNDENVTAINTYLDAKMTATWFNDTAQGPKSRETITNELIYHWMIEFGIPMECQHWHLNRLFTLIKVRNVKLNPPKKMNAKDLAERNRRLNAERRAKLGTSG